MAARINTAGMKQNAAGCVGPIMRNTRFFTALLMATPLALGTFAATGQEVAPTQPPVAPPAQVGRTGQYSNELPPADAEEPALSGQIAAPPSLTTPQDQPDQVAQSSD